MKMRYFCVCLCVMWQLLGPAYAANPRYASIVVDVQTGRVLHQISSQERIYPASLTKMMTLYLVFDALHRGQLRLNQKIPISRWAAQQEPSSLGLKPGDWITVEKAILSLVCRSANDIAVALAEAVGGSERRFARLMTARAWSLGLKRTSFHNATGLFHPKQMTTAHDMARLGIFLVKHFPKEYAYFKRRKFSFRGKIHKSHNKLVGNVHGVDGLKTGYIRKAGFNLVTSAKRKQKRLMAVVIGGKTAKWRDQRMVSLLEMGFRHANLNQKSLKRMPNWQQGPFLQSASLGKPVKPKRRRPKKQMRSVRFLKTRRAMVAKARTVDDLLTAS